METRKNTRVVFQTPNLDNGIEFTKATFNDSSARFLDFEFGKVYYMVRGDNLVAFKVHAANLYKHVTNGEDKVKYLVEFAGEKPQWCDPFGNVDFVFESKEDYTRFAYGDKVGVCLRYITYNVNDRYKYIKKRINSLFGLPKASNSMCVNPFKWWWCWSDRLGRCVEADGYLYDKGIAFVITKDGLSTIFSDKYKGIYYPSKEECYKAHMGQLKVTDFEETDTIDPLAGIDTEPKKSRAMRVTITIE